MNVDTYEKQNYQRGLLSAQLCFCHKVKHVPFDNITYGLETVRTETFEKYQKFIVVDNKNRMQAIL